MKKILIISVLLGLISCNTKETKGDITQQVYIDNSFNVTWDSKLNVPVYNQNKEWYTLYTRYKSIYLSGGEGAYSIDHGPAEYIDSIKCIRKSEAKNELIKLERLNEPCN